MDCSVDICSGVILQRLQGDNLLHHGLLHRLQGDNLLHRGIHQGLQGNHYSGAWSTSSPSFFSARGVCRAVSLTFFSLLSHSGCTAFFTLSYVYYHRGNTSVGDGLSFGQQWVCFGVGWDWLSPTWGQLLVSSCRRHPRSLLPPPPHHVNPIPWEMLEVDEQAGKRVQPHQFPGRTCLWAGAALWELLGE